MALRSTRTIASHCKKYETKPNVRLSLQRPRHTPCGRRSVSPDWMVVVTHDRRVGDELKLCIGYWERITLTHEPVNPLIQIITAPLQALSGLKTIRHPIIRLVHLAIHSLRYDFLESVAACDQQLHELP